MRSVLRILVEKELVTHREDGPRYVYLPAVSPNRARDEALSHVVRTFFEGSAEQAMTALLRMSDTRLGRRRAQPAGRAGQEGTEQWEVTWNSSNSSW